MIRHFLIDFENVHEGGLTGLPALTANDRVYLFYTKNANQIHMHLQTLVDLLTGGVRAQITAYEIASGKQSLDMQLVSFLGSLIGSEQDAGHHYIIVSRDADYRNTIAFWNSVGMQRLEMAPSIDQCSQPAPVAIALPAQPEKKKSSGRKSPSRKAARPAPAPCVEKSPPADKGVLNNAVQQLLSKKKTGGSKISHVASVAVKYVDKENGRDLIFNDLLNEYGAVEGPALFGLIEPLL